jgi:hypothetical protein
MLKGMQKGFLISGKKIRQRSFKVNFENTENDTALEKSINAKANIKEARSKQKEARSYTYTWKLYNSSTCFTSVG